MGAKNELASDKSVPIWAQQWAYGAQRVVIIVD